MTIQEAIKKAIEGGWGLNGVPEATDAIYVAEKEPEVALLDSLFWQSLGKAMGWSEKLHMGMNSVPLRKQNIHSVFTPCNYLCKPEYVYQWHRMIDHLAEGGTIDGIFSHIGHDKIVNYKNELHYL